MIRSRVTLATTDAAAIEKLKLTLTGQKELQNLKDEHRQLLTEYTRGEIAEESERGREAKRLLAASSAEVREKIEASRETAAKERLDKIEQGRSDRRFPCGTPPT